MPHHLESGYAPAIVHHHRAAKAFYAAAALHPARTYGPRIGF